MPLDLLIVTMFEVWILGAITASFLGVVAERIPQDRSVGGRSHCVCGRQLKLRENIPVFGWLIARGRAKCCGAAIPTFYPISEASLAFWWAASVPLGLPWNLISMVIGAAVVGLVGIRVLRSTGSDSFVLAEKVTAVSGEESRSPWG